MKPVIIGLLLSISPITLLSQQNTAYKEDFNYFWSAINDEYCYFSKKHTDWQEVKSIYAPQVDSVKSRDEFVSILEKMFNEIYDHHAGLNTNTMLSKRLVPSGSDLWAAFVNGKPVITEVRRDFGAARSGIKAGMEIIRVNDVPVDKAVADLLPKTLKENDIEAKNFALRSLLAGNHTNKRKLSLKYNGVIKDYQPDKDGFFIDLYKYPSMVESNRIGNIGYIKVNDYLYDNAMVNAFDSVMSTMNNTYGLIIDLRETASGGNTTVAKAILGWFTNKEKFYQKHEYYYDEKTTGIKRSWEEIVSPRKNKYYDKPLVILSDHWTGSIAEGITIGFDALRRANTRIIGTELARLNGAVYSYELPNTRIRFSFPAERLYHVNGTAREKYLPPVLIDPSSKEALASPDIFMDKAIQYLKTVIK